ncbi:bifunctional anthranilate synthase component I family protein/aminotransferase class IV [Macrococcus epidermidis]|uniref:bifunctional chorismate-binding protein/class IV aminotransferase n=1 Tax=Macrococcus epidermidis TaxID=1902580 RepID=UPI001EF289BD|nr:bifunctional anthranilate synthase component I family protein/class IV aminotransferase [Macrococcus epidermidis]MCG7419484.1 bifunctional anthranilate synthase component I family protein/aminotransferase class IV [Macrococcus epidermidis]
MKAEINFKYIAEKDRNYHFKFEQPFKIVVVNDADKVEAALREAETSGYIVLTVMKYEASRLFDPLLSTKDSDQLIKFYYFNRESVINKSFNEEAPNITLDFQFMNDKAHIIKQIEAIQQEIRLGNTYQVNYTTRLLAKNNERNLYHVYEKLSKQHGDYTAYIEDDTQTIVSISPELFFQYDFSTKEVLTKPMKGTMPTDSNPVKDTQNFQFLKESVKDRAENVMIVDLLRNDLSKIAKKGSVKVPHLFTIERFKSVYQMTSTITATLEDKGLYDIMKALFPCGSITGAPKQSTMNIINRLEDTERSVYCGTIGLIVPNEVAIFNVPIRTLEYNHNEEVVTYGVGGGITIDSNPELEYDEMVAKSKILDYIRDTSVTLPDDFHLIETMRVERGEIKRKAYHKARMMKALNHFKIDYDENELDSLFDSTFHDIKEVEPFMLRITVDCNGNISSSIKSIVTFNHNAALRLMHFNKKAFHQNKTSVRSQYASEGLTLFHDDTYLLEFNIGNAVIESEGVYYTPKHDYILNGCMRSALLDRGEVKEAEIEVATFIEKYRAGEVKLYMINSLREWVQVTLQLK